jgi:hypothetical protein
MTTITGKLEDATGAALHATIDFVSRSTPLAGAGVITTNTDKTIRSNPSDGTFSVALAAGNYAVTIAANGQTTNFNITVPDGEDTLAIDSLVSTPLAFVFTPPNTVFNGVLGGNLTFSPLAPPVAPAWTLVDYSGGNVSAVGLEHYTYWLTYVTQCGETSLGARLDLEEGPGNADKANRILLPAAITGVTAVKIWRSWSSPAHTYAGIPPVEMGLLASVSASAGYYDDFENMAQFSARVDSSIVPQTQNTTAGQIIGTMGGTAALMINDQGVSAPNQPLGPTGGVITKALLDQVFGGGLSTSDVLFRFAAGQIQFWDVAAGAASPGTPWRALGVNNGQTVWSGLLADGGTLDDPFAIPSGANYRFANGQFQFWDAAQAVTTPATPWRAIGISAGAVYWSAPIADAGATLDTLPNPPNANWRARNGQLQIWDQSQALLDISRPWRAVAPVNGASVVSAPISN